MASPDPLNNSLSYYGVRLTPEATHKAYWGIPWPHKQTRGTMPAGVCMDQLFDLCTRSQ